MGVLALIVIFQPEIRRALEQLGRGSFLKRYTSNTYSKDEEIDSIGFKGCAIYG